MAWIAAFVPVRRSVELGHFADVAEVGRRIVEDRAFHETVGQVTHDGARRAYPEQRADYRLVDSAYTRSHLDLAAPGSFAKGRGSNLAGVQYFGNSAWNPFASELEGFVDDAGMEHRLA